ncbi:MAG: hypothetical protein ACXVB9_11450 [Bdellovibrionota bacterium]
MSFLALVVLFSIPASAEDLKSPPPAAVAVTVAPPAAAPVTYELRDLKPAGFTQYVGAGDMIRQYFDFQNDLGMHHLIYEEAATAPPVRSLQGLRQASVAYDSECSMDIECSSKAFCLSDCKHMYYETANIPGDSIAPDRNKCRLIYFSCEKAAPKAVAPAAPVATPAKSPGT